MVLHLQPKEPTDQGVRFGSREVEESREYAPGWQGWVCNQRLDLRTSPPQPCNAHEGQADTVPSTLLHHHRTRMEQRLHTRPWTALQDQVRGVRGVASVMLALS